VGLWYFANAKSKNGASNVDPDPVSVRAEPLAAASDGEAGPVAMDVHALSARTVIAATPMILFIAR
jgi:hypothetical protein